jgi:ArsR family transcriptional regulator, arsenate/arsenite/antimonite-responsive transcriptional repressor
MDDERIAACFAALSSPVRLKLFRHLMDAAPSGIGPTALSEMCDMPRNLVSYHLGPLRASSLVLSAKSGRDVAYRVSPTALAEFAIGFQGLVMGRV